MEIIIEILAKILNLQDLRRKGREQNWDNSSKHDDCSRMWHSVITCCVSKWSQLYCDKEYVCHPPNEHLHCAIHLIWAQNAQGTLSMDHQTTTLPQPTPLSPKPQQQIHPPNTLSHHHPLHMLTPLLQWMPPLLCHIFILTPNPSWCNLTILLDLP